MKFKSKIDLWWYLLVLLFIGISIYAFLPNSKISVSVGWILLISDILLLIPPMFFSYYTVDQNYLVLRCGLLYKKIPISSICDIYTVDSILATTFATSFTRVGIRYKRKHSSHVSCEYISPIEREKFIEVIHSLKK